MHHQDGQISTLSLKTMGKKKRVRKGGVPKYQELTPARCSR
ncbi:MAG: hypothetical protein ACTSVI_06475 [Promethearchaeota archaeon]